MIFIYLSFLSALALGILISRERKQTKLSFLQILKRSCSIDSVQFESHLKQSKQQLSQVKKVNQKRINTVSKKIQSQYQKHLLYVKKFIRNKLHPETEVVAESFFIKEIKNNSDK